MQSILNTPKLIRAFVRKNKLYTNLHLLVLSMVLSVLLMQAGSLFLFDYIPDHLAVVNRAYQDQSVWKLGVSQLEADFTQKNNIYNRLNENQSEFEGVLYAWAKKQEDTDLGAAYRRLIAARQDFAKARVMGAAKAEMIGKGNVVVKAYSEFVSAAEHDITLKQSLVSLLQLACLVLVFCIASCIMLISWDVLIRRLGRIVTTVPNERILSEGNSQYNDEFEQIEKLTDVLSARLEGIDAETKWFSKTSTERMRKMLISQDYLLKLTKTLNSSGLSEITIKKTLYSLEKALDVNNVALIFSENGSQISAQRGLFSSYWPPTFDESIFDENSALLSITQETKLINEESIQSFKVALPSSNGWLGVLLIEADVDHYFEESELHLFEVTAQILALSMGFQSKVQESRRVALLEERAVIARELHDSLAQSLSYMKFQIARLQTNFNPQLVQFGADTIVNDMREGLDNAYRELRELLTTFRVQMDIRGLDHVIEEAIQEFSQRSSLNIALDNRLQDCKLSVNEEFHLLHVIREALSNIVRHSGADKVSIALVLQLSGDVVVTIDDNGKGLSFDKTKPHHYGIAIMTERASCLGGSIEFLTRRQGGTRVRLLFHPKQSF